jgi:hypothetical protein
MKNESRLAIRMAGAVNMTIMTRVGFIFDMSRVDRDTSCLLFGGLVNLCIVCKFGTTPSGKNLGDGSCQGRLAMVDMTLGLARGVGGGKKVRKDKLPMVPMFM